MLQHGLSATLVLILAACSTDATVPPPAPQQPAATGSASFAVVAVADRLKAYIPEDSYGVDGHARLRVVDAAAKKSGGSGHLGEVDLGTSGRADAVAATPGLVIAIGVMYPVIWFIDPATDRVTTRIDLPDSYGAWEVSGRTAFMSGVIIDAARRRAYVSVWSGFIVLDLDSRAIVDEVLVAPSENFGFDPERNRLVAPFYGCPPRETASGSPPPCGSYLSPDGTLITQGINVIDLATGKVFTYVDPAAPDQAAPAGLEPDSAAVDPTGNRVLVAAESTAELLLLDLGTTASFDDLARTFTAPKVTLTVEPGLTGLGIDPGSRLGFAMQENGALILPLDLPTLTVDGMPAGATMPDLPWGAGPWRGHGDPHGALTGLFEGKTVAWLTNVDHTWLARVDLTRLSQLHQASPGGISGADMASLVTYIYAYPAP